jgi:hypothetical protein
MQFTAQQMTDFGVALNEATFVGLEVILEYRGVALTFSTLALPSDDGPPPADPRVQIRVGQVGRIAASLRNGNWDDQAARVERFELDQLSDVVDSFEQQPIYGRRFLDMPDADNFDQWKNRLSLDWRSEPGGTAHTLDLFQEGVRVPLRHLDLRIWFDGLWIVDPEIQPIAFDDFTAAGVRWWKAMREGDPRTRNQGIVPAAPWPDAPPRFRQRTSQNPSPDQAEQ